MITLQVYGERTMYEDDILDPVDKLMMQLRWTFSAKIK